MTRRPPTRLMAVIAVAVGMALYVVPGTAAASLVQSQLAMAQVTTGPVTTATVPLTTGPVTTGPVTTGPVTTGPVTSRPVASVPVATAPGAITVTLPPEPADNSWAIAIAAVLLALAVAVVAVVAGFRRAAARNWRPAGGAALPPIAAEMTRAGSAGGPTDDAQNSDIESGSTNDSSP